MRCPQRREPEFCGESPSGRAELERMHSIQFEIVGNLDADFSSRPITWHFLYAEDLTEDPELGVAGTPFTQDGDYDSSKDSFEGGELCRRDLVNFFGVQVFSGYRRLRGRTEQAGLDWIAAMTARMRGWKNTLRFPKNDIIIYRSMGTAEKRPFATALFFLWGKKIITWEVRRYGNCSDVAISNVQKSLFSGRACAAGSATVGGAAKN